MSEEPLFDIKAKGKEFQRMADELQKNALQYRIKAKASLERNREDEAKIYAEESSQLNAEAKEMKLVGVELECAAAEMKMGIASKETAEVLQSVNQAIQSDNRDPVKACYNMRVFNDELRSINVGMEVLDESMNTDVVTNKDAMELMEELEAEIGVAAMVDGKSHVQLESEDKIDLTMRGIIEDVKKM